MWWVRTRTRARWGLVSSLALLLGLVANPSQAQGNGNGIRVTGPNEVFNGFQNIGRNTMNMFQGAMNRTSGLVLNQRYRHQCEMVWWTDFPCKYHEKRSKSVPKSVHKLRPGDIDVIAAMGDSITAGTGAMADNVFQISVEYRGVVFSIGGDLSWREILTLPNILKEFNPRLYGYSVGSKKFNSDEPTALNFAEYGATAEDMTKQAYKLIHRLKCDRHVDFKRHWKMVTILVGHNDICAHSCGMRPPFGPEKDGSPKVYLKNMAKVLDVLHRELPRTFVNLLPIANVGKLLDIFEKPLPCQITHPYGCPCLFGGQNTLSRSKIQYLLNEYLQGLENLVNSGRYDTRSDFTVVIQPNLVQGDVPQHRPDRFARLQPNLDYLAPDCFHWAQKTHAKLARAVWNNLLLPIGNKSLNFEVEGPFLCPTKSFPYITTSLNSHEKRRTDFAKEMASDYNHFLDGPSGAQDCPL